MRAPACAALAALAVCLPGCGESEPEPEPVAPGSATEQPTSAAPVATSLGQLNCTDWERAEADTRADIVAELQAFAAGQVTGEGVAGTGPVLASEETTQLFHNRCGPHYARGFLLYKLYFHAASLAGG
jgi:hypothetical protein